MIKFYSAWFCPYAQRAWLTLEHYQIPHTIVESLKVNKNQEEGDHGYTKDQRLLQLNPKGLVPTLEVSQDDIKEASVYNEKITDKVKEVVFDGSSYYVVTDSIVCMEFLHSIGKEKGSNNLIPEEVYLEDAGKFDKVVCSTFYKILMKPTKEEQKEAYNIFLQGINEFLSYVESDGYYKSMHPTIVDFTIIPWMLRIPVLKHYRSFVDDIDSNIKLNAYINRMKNLDAVKNTLWSDKNAILEVYRRYADGSAESQVGQAVKAGKDVHEV
jgi:glutathione S-transferase